MAIDTLKVANRLREAGFTEPQAEAVIAVVQDATQGADLATKGDLAESLREFKAEIAALRAEFKAEIAALRAEFKAEIVALRAEVREVELRLESRIEALKSEILGRVFAMILGSLVVNIIAIVGAMFAVAKLVAH
jgi:Protein of unknown function (DUF1640)